MNKALIFVAVLLAVVFLVGCTSSQNSGYATYNQPQGQQNQYVGGGCGVAPSGAYENTPIEALGAAHSSL